MPDALRLDVDEYGNYLKDFVGINHVFTKLRLIDTDR